jgi:DnaJ like chaperone protein
VIALGAKMAKADGQVTRDEVAAFRTVFTIPPEEEANAARVFNLARQDVAGFDAYARKIAAMFGPGDRVLIDLSPRGFSTSPLRTASITRPKMPSCARWRRSSGWARSLFPIAPVALCANDPPDPYDVLGVRTRAGRGDPRSGDRRCAKATLTGWRRAACRPRRYSWRKTGLCDVNRAWEAISGKKAA